MEGKRITAEELEAVLQGDVKALAERIAQAINAAKAGRIIADSEEPVRDAHAVFRQQAYQRALDLLQNKALQEGFPPHKTQPRVRWRNKGPQKTSHLTVNGRVEFLRTVYWNKQAGTLSPLDELLGIATESYSPGVREMACRVSLNEAFAPGSEVLARTAQLSISRSALRDLVEREGRRAEIAIRQGQSGPNWTAAECTHQTVISGSDGVMVPAVTEEQKRRRRASEAKKRRKAGRRSTARPGRPKGGTDGPYKEFKIVSFYDPDKAHKYAVGTRGDHEALGRLMRREAGKVKIDQARCKYSVTDGAEWIARQYAAQLPMLDENILDYYHLRDHVITTSHVLYGEGTAKARAWREEMMDYVWNQGSLVMLDHLGNYLRCHRSGPKAEALHSLREYVGKRIDMTDYPTYRQKGYDCGSGPTESFCGTLSKRLKGRGMRWDTDNAESIMVLGSLYYSNLWADYWAEQLAA
ncbi:MAG: UPF0236 family protein [Chloroflexota bacterium]